MTKYYYKDIPDKIHVIYGIRQYGKTNYEFNKIKEENEKRIKELEEENKKLKYKIQELKICIKKLLHIEGEENENN